LIILFQAVFEINWTIRTSHDCWSWSRQSFGRNLSWWCWSIWNSSDGWCFCWPTSKFSCTSWSSYWRPNRGRILINVFSYFIHVQSFVSIQGVVEAPIEIQDELLDDSQQNLSDQA
jgi:hypothetical protein